MVESERSLSHALSFEVSKTHSRKGNKGSERELGQERARDRGT